MSLVSLGLSGVGVVPNLFVAQGGGLGEGREPMPNQGDLTP